jgi:hypothetical protein
MMIPPGDLAGRKAIAGAPRGLAADVRNRSRLRMPGKPRSQWRLSACRMQHSGKLDCAKLLSIAI